MGGISESVKYFYIHTKGQKEYLQVSIDENNKIALVLVSSPKVNDFALLHLYSRATASGHDNPNISVLGLQCGESERVLHFVGRDGERFGILARGQREVWTVYDENIRKQKKYTYAVNAKMEEEVFDDMGAIERCFERLSLEDRISVVKKLVAKM